MEHDDNPKNLDAGNMETPRELSSLAAEHLRHPQNDYDQRNNASVEANALLDFQNGDTSAYTEEMGGCHTSEGSPRGPNRPHFISMTGNARKHGRC
jgi:hypothetical protein